MNERSDLKRVLIVDDERAITDSLVTIFRQSGYDPKGAYSAEEALSITDNWPPALAIIDVVLPGMNGVDLALLLRAELPDCQVFLISGQIATESILQRAVANGQSLYIHAKPIHPLDLIAAASRSSAESKGTPNLSPD